MVAEGDEEVEEELAASVVHLELHGAASLEGAAAADDEGEVVGAQLGVGVGGVGVGVAGGCENSAALDAGLFVRCQECRGMGTRMGWNTHGDLAFAGRPSSAPRARTSPRRSR